jgi:hypothetical protein
MADRYPTWAAEQAATSRGPSMAATLVLFALLTVLLLRALGGPAAVSEWSGADRLEGVSLCEEHAGRPGWDSVCAKTPVAHKRR